MIRPIPAASEYTARDTRSLRTVSGRVTGGYGFGNLEGGSKYGVWQFGGVSKE
jgi:hypothetical protein